MSDRCSAASRDRGDDLAGTASTVRGFLLLEHDGPWGEDAMRDARLPDGLGAELARRTGEARLRPVLVRRPGRRRPAGAPSRVVVAHPPTRSLHGTTVADLRDVLDLDLDALGRGEPAGLEQVPGPLLLVCTHGRHDACCAEQGRPVALAMRDDDAVWECSHIGGDRFAGNLVVLPDGLYYGRVDVAGATRIAAAARRGEVDLVHLRGRTTLPMPVQYAEVALRRELGLVGVDDVRVDRVTRSGDDWTVHADAHGAHTVVVRRQLGEGARLTCRARRDNPVPSHVLVSLTRDTPPP